MRSLPILAAALALAACASEPAPPPAPAPAAAPGQVTRDPIREAVIDAGAWFARPQANQPAAAARALAQVEYLADTMPTDPRYQTANAAGLGQLQVARREARRALGVASGASGTEVVEGLRAAATALEGQDQAAAAAALPRSVFTLGPQATLQRLAQPPRVPSARQALTSLGQAR